ncbi:MAG TPA: glutamine-hydrolyzing GMP synthase, partial [Bellilinea sp.]|nr:glutamine-hydrolyzing GMP synthase [Bellilinea sp.]
MIVILDFGSQYSQIIARKVRDMHVYCELLPWDVTADRLATLNPRGYILSGGPASVYAADAPTLNPAVLQAEVPVLGICYGMQVLAHTLGGEVASSDKHEYGRAINRTTRDNPLLDRGEQQVWMSHGDSVRTLPPGFQSLAESENCPITAMVNPQKNIYALQFHPEVQHTVGGDAILRRFVLEICGCTPEWTAESIINAAVEKVRAQVGDAEVLSAVSGGVDSTVATALVQKAVGRQLHTVFVDHGLLRLGEREQVEATLRPMLGENLKVVDASERFLTNLRGVTEPEAKRKVIGETFIRVFEEQAREVGSPRFLVQGTIYPDVVESAANESGKAQRIKSHHNVGGLPKDMKFELVEPLRMLFKDEVRAIGEALGLPEDMVWRQPFPGPGL